VATVGHHLPPAGLSPASDRPWWAYDEDELARWLARHHRELFEEELNGWYTDPALWPRDRSLKMLQEWCSFELHTVVVDTGDSPLEDDEFDE
jgi:hypothetical protein